MCHLFHRVWQLFSGDYHKRCRFLSILGKSNKLRDIGYMQFPSLFLCVIPWISMILSAYKFSNTFRYIGVLQTCHVDFPFSMQRSNASWSNNEVFESITQIWDIFIRKNMSMSQMTDLLESFGLFKWYPHSWDLSWYTWHRWLIFFLNISTS